MSVAVTSSGKLIAHKLRVENRSEIYQRRVE